MFRYRLYCCKAFWLHRLGIVLAYFVEKYPVTSVGLLSKCWADFLYSAYSMEFLARFLFPVVSGLSASCSLYRSQSDVLFNHVYILFFICPSLTYCVRSVAFNRFLYLCLVSAASESTSDVLDVFLLVIVGIMLVSYSCASRWRLLLSVCGLKVFVQVLVPTEPSLLRDC